MVRGLSPRMRGNQLKDADNRPLWGSIPAHAGEPRWARQAGRTPRVYPRACGGTFAMTLKQIRDWGLSPRMRGNLQVGEPLVAHLGSIPAHAGEPSWRTGSTEGTRVYPRACGGTPGSFAPDPCFRGLSPRMRGNRPHLEVDGTGVGSIPAHAGEPAPGTPAHRRAWVYPRACGGTGASNQEGSFTSGLSPRMRGNQIQGELLGVFLGSIPAHAGEPPPGRAPPNRSGVYPRACGGTASRSAS